MIDLEVALHGAGVQTQVVTDMGFEIRDGGPNGELVGQEITQ